MNDSQENIGQFNLVALTLLNKLYESFPTPLNLGPHELNDIGFSAVPVEATEEQEWATGTMADDVFTFLAEEGFVRYEVDVNNRQGYFWKARLSLKGLAILSSSSNEEKETFAQKIKRALATITTTAGIELGKHVVTEILKQALKSGVS